MRLVSLRAGVSGVLAVVAAAAALVLAAPAAPAAAASFDDVTEAQAYCEATFGEDWDTTRLIVENTFFETVVEQDVSYAASVSVAGLGGAPLAGVDLASDAAIIAALVAAGVEADSIVISRSQAKTGSTEEVQTSFDFELGDPEAGIFGDLDDWPNLIVVCGTLTVNVRSTITETQQILETVTITGVLSEEPPKPKCPWPPKKSPKKQRGWRW
jgi:hypothetical protein